MRRSRRYIVIAVAVSLCASLAIPGGAAAHKISKKSAERSAFRVAKSVARQTGASLWYAGVCRRAKAHRVNCWAAVVYDDYEGCAQRVRVTTKGHSRKLRAKRVGKIYCADLSEEFEENGGGSSSGSGGEWAICGIRSSVCIGS